MYKKVLRFVLVLIGLLVLMSPLFIKVNIECKSQTGECPVNLNSKLKSMNNKSLFIARKGVVKILRQDFLVVDYSMQLNLPNKLLINTIIKKPIYAIFDKSKNKYLLVDSLGTITSYSDKANLPTLIKDSVNENEGETVTESDLFALKLISGIYQMYQVDTGLTQNDTLVVDLHGGVRVILPLTESDSQVLLGSLRLIYTKITTENNLGYSQIDLRFKNPVIR